MNVRDMEARVMRQCIADLLDAGFEVSVYDGEETTVQRSTDAKAIFAAMRTTDEDRLYVYRPDENIRFGWVFFVYGNGGYDVINDHTTNLEETLARTTALCDELGG